MLGVRRGSGECEFQRGEETKLGFSVGAEEGDERVELYGDGEGAAGEGVRVEVEVIVDGG